MGQKDIRKILRVYFENPEEKFTVRDISRLAGIPRATSHKETAKLKKEDYFKDELFFKIKKINYYIEELFSSGLIRFLISELNPSLIILFGSFRKGDSDKKSDVDLFVESPVGKELNLKKFEGKIGHKIDLLVEANIKKLNDNLFNNVANGIKLYGSFKIK